MPTSTGSVTGFPYYPMSQPQFFIQYKVAAWWNSATMVLGIIPGSRVFNSNYQIDYWASECPYHLGKSSLGTLYAHPTGTPNQPVNYFQTQQLMINASPNGKVYLGEVENNAGNFVFPPECLITKNPKKGEIVEGVSTVFLNDVSSDIIRSDFHWKYQTLDHLDSWGPHEDVWWTSLIEYGTEEWVYNYIFKRNVGIVDLWYGKKDQWGNVSDGFEIYCPA